MIFGPFTGMVDEHYGMDMNASGNPSNNSPDFDLFHNGTAVTRVNSPGYADSGGLGNCHGRRQDQHRAGRDTSPADAMSLIYAGNGTASIAVASQGLSPDAYVFWVVVSDQDNREREPYAVEAPSR